MVTTLQIKQEEGLNDMWSLANEKCADGKKIENLILSGEFSISELESSFFKDNLDKAQIWQNKERPHDHKFTHGEYLDKYSMTALDYLIKELKFKKDSNRACWSLIDMGTFIGSGDKPIPSFLTLQARISEDNKGFSITCYYRALEVHKFLPINISEICLVADKINKEFASYNFTSFSIVIHAFNAYRDDFSDSLKKATIDSIEIIKMSTKVCCDENGKKWVIEILENKKDHNESHIEIEGIKNLITCIEGHIEEYDEKTYYKVFLSKLKCIEKEILAHNKMSQESSYSMSIKMQGRMIKKTIDEAINLI